VAQGIGAEARPPAAMVVDHQWRQWWSRPRQRVCPCRQRIIGWLLNFDAKYCNEATITFNVNDFESSGRNTAEVLILLREA
jgi:hypothetical protein